jgi:hypothetical protein
MDSTTRDLVCVGAYREAAYKLNCAGIDSRAILLSVPPILPYGVTPVASERHFSTMALSGIGRAR